MSRAQLKLTPYMEAPEKPVREKKAKAAVGCAGAAVEEEDVEA